MKPSRIFSALPGKKYAGEGLPDGCGESSGKTQGAIQLNGMRELRAQNSADQSRSNGRHPHDGAFPADRSSDQVRDGSRTEVPKDPVESIHPIGTTEEPSDTEQDPAGYGHSQNEKRVGRVDQSDLFQYE